jgi:hypothetical protein
MNFFITLLAHLFLSFNYDNGSTLELSDGSKWTISPDDTSVTSLWLIPMEIQIEPSNDKTYPYILINLQTKQKVKAKKG